MIISSLICTFLMFYWFQPWLELIVITISELKILKSNPRVSLVAFIVSFTKSAVTTNGIISLGLSL
jgi:hypothetical protein